MAIRANQRVLGALGVPHLARNKRLDPDAVDGRFRVGSPGRCLHYLYPNFALFLGILDYRRKGLSRIGLERL
jgi:hypothetical protein